MVGINLHVMPSACVIVAFSVRWDVEKHCWDLETGTATFLEWGGVHLLFCIECCDNNVQRFVIVIASLIL